MLYLSDTPGNNQQGDNKLRPEFPDKETTSTGKYVSEDLHFEKKFLSGIVVPHLPKTEPWRRQSPRGESEEPLWHYSVTTEATCRPEGSR